MEAEIFKYILKNKGSVDTEELLFNLGHASTLPEINSNKDKFVSCLWNGQPKVLVRSRVKLCWAKDCPGCGGLHLCKGFLLSGSCQFTQTRRGCIFSHELHSVYNQRILQEFGLETLSRTELCTLLLQSCPILLPSVCYDYNNGMGLNGQCQDDCQRLHICEKYLKGNCSCSRTHDFLSPQPLKCLQEKHIPLDLIPSLRSVYANKEALKIADRSAGRGNRRNRGGPLTKKAVSCGDLLAAVDLKVDGSSSGVRPMHRQRDRNEICMFFIKGHCKHEDRCFKAHDKMPYRWQIKQDGQWTALAENEKIEKDYCDPEKTYSTTSPPVHFDTMKRGTDEVRRLSTISSVLQPDYIHTTDWLWYWEDEYGKWYQYAAITSEHKISSISSQELEELYQKKDKDVVEFTAGSHRYSLSLQDLFQTNLKYSTKRLVRRRPRFVSTAEVQAKRRRPGNSTAVPENWDKTQISPAGHTRVCLQPSSGEHKEIQELFCKTMPGFNILQIERIQNKALWEAFKLQKNHMKNNNNGRLVEEKKLFHGTNPKFVDTICATNFDWRVCGVNGTAYGQGSYFARDAKYSHRYTGTSAVRFMFVSRVLVGEYTKGRSEYRRPPSKDESDVNLYDSCVDNVADPSIFVVFEKHQIYPEYLLQYEPRSLDAEMLLNVSGTRQRNQVAAIAPNTTTSRLIDSWFTDLYPVPKPTLKYGIQHLIPDSASVSKEIARPPNNAIAPPIPPRRAATLLEMPIPRNVPKPMLTPTVAEKPKISLKPVVIPSCFTNPGQTTLARSTASASYLYTLDYLKKL